MDLIGSVLLFIVKVEDFHLEQFYKIVNNWLSFLPIFLIYAGFGDYFLDTIVLIEAFFYKFGVFDSFLLTCRILILYLFNK